MARIRNFIGTSVVGITLAFTSVAHGSISTGVIPNRATLNAHLVTSTTENFETYVTGSSTAASLATATLNSSTIINGQGPNLVKPGVQFSGSWFGGATDSFQWNSTGFVGSTSRQIHTYVDANRTTARPTMNIDFATPVGAFGLDISAYCQGYDDIATVTVLAANDLTVLYQSPGIYLASPPNAPQIYNFFGYEDPSGIGGVILTPTNRSWSPILDNLTSGQVPEPSAPAATLILLPILAALRKRKNPESRPLGDDAMPDRGERDVGNGRTTTATSGPPPHIGRSVRSPRRSRPYGRSAASADRGKPRSASAPGAARMCRRGGDRDRHALRASI